MFKKIIGLFSNKFKSVPNIEYKPTGYIINKKIYTFSTSLKYFIIELENFEHSFEELFIEFLLIKTLYSIDNLTLLIYIQFNNKDIKNKLKEILTFFNIKNFIFIDDYNIAKENLEIVYLNQYLLVPNNKIMIYNPNFIFKTNLIYDLLDHLILFKNQFNINLTLNNSNLSSKIQYYIPNIQNSYLFDLSDNYFIDRFYLKNLIKKYNIEKQIIVFTKNSEFYKEIFPENTIFIDFEELASKLVFIRNKEFIKLFCFNLSKYVFLNNNNSMILGLILNFIQEIIHNKQDNIIYLYNQNINLNLFNHIKSITKKYLYEFNTNIISKPLSIAFFTRLTRIDNIEQIYNNIKNICNISFTNYKWFIFIPYNKLFNYNIPKIIQNDLNVIIFNQYLSFNNNDDYDVTLMNIGLYHKEILYCQFLYVLDDDNLIHPNLINVIKKNLDKYLIINKLELSDTQKINNYFLKFECPTDLTESNCIGKVDYANCIFNIYALKSIGGFNLSSGALYSDGATVLTFIKSGIQIIYSNEIAGYYNYLKEK